MAAPITTVTRKTDDVERGTAGRTRRIRRQVPRASLCAAISSRCRSARSIVHAAHAAGRRHPAPPSRRVNGNSLPDGYDNIGGDPDLPERPLLARGRPDRGSGAPAPRARPRSCSGEDRAAAPASSALISTTASRGAASSAATRSAVAASSSSTRHDHALARPIRSASAAPTRRPVSADLQRPGVADQLDQSLGAGQVRHQPERHLGHGELRVVGQHPQVTGERELEPGADRVALHGGDAR